MDAALQDLSRILSEYPLYVVSNAAEMIKTGVNTDYFTANEIAAMNRVTQVDDGISVLELGSTLPSNVTPPVVEVAVQLASLADVGVMFDSADDVADFVIKNNGDMPSDITDDELTAIMGAELIDDSMDYIDDEAIIAEYDYED